MLRKFPDSPIRAIVVWEPVLGTDIAAPMSAVLALISDSRASQFWDPGLAVSRDIVRAVRTDPQRYGFDEALPEGYIVWDVVAVFGIDVQWSDDLPVPAYYDGPVFAASPGLRTAIDRELDEDDVFDTTSPPGGGGGPGFGFTLADTTGCCLRFR